MNLQELIHHMFDLDRCLFDTDSMRPGLAPVFGEALLRGGCDATQVPTLIDALWSMPLVEVVTKYGLGAELADELTRMNADLPIPPEACLFEDSVPVLEELKRRGQPCHLITKGLQGFQTRKLEHLGISGYFREVHIVGEGNRFLTKLEAVRYIMAEQSIGPETLHVIGDGHEELSAAHTVGATSIQTLRPGVKRLSAHHHVVQLSEMLHLS